jgi:hypothetical protein
MCIIESVFFVSVNVTRCVLLPHKHRSTIFTTPALFAIFLRMTIFAVPLSTLTKAFFRHSLCAYCSKLFHFLSNKLVF